MTPQAAARRVRALPPEDVTIELWLASWLVFFPPQRKDATAEHDDAMLRPFLRAHGRKLLSAVTPLMAQQWAVRNPSQLRYLRRAWEKAVAMRIVEYNVWKCVELPRRTTPPRPVPTLKQLDRALAVARERGGWWLEFADMVEATAFTGARLGGITSLRRSDVDLDARRVILCEKGAKSRRVVLAGRSLDAMRCAMAREHPPLWNQRLVFLSETGSQLERGGVGRAWRSIRGDFPGPFHSLKHFGGTWLASQGVDERDIAIQLGHYDAAGRPYVHLVRRVYVHPDHDEALARIERQIAASAASTYGADEITPQRVVAGFSPQELR